MTNILINNKILFFKSF